MSEHALCCDCEDCLNGAGGYTLPGAGATKADPTGKRREKAQYGVSWQPHEGGESEQLRERQREGTAT